MAPTNWPSFSIGTARCDRAPASLAEGLVKSSTVHTTSFEFSSRLRGGSFTRQEACALRARLTIPIKFGECRCGVKLSYSVKRLSVIAEHKAKFCLANLGGIFQHSLENGVQFARRRANDTQHLGSRRLLLQRFGEIGGALSQFIEQPRVLDGDHRLVSEGGNQFNLPLGEWANRGACQSEHADDVALAYERDAQHGVVVAKSQGLTQLVVGICLGIENMYCRATERGAADYTSWSWLEVLPPQLLAEGS